MKNQKHILIIDDDVNILNALRFMLEAEGFKVTTSENADYVNKLHKYSKLPNIIILDVLLSGRDGRKICKQLKSQSNTKNIPIIIISAHPTAKNTSIRSGADDFVAKPFDIQYILEKINKFNK